VLDRPVRPERWPSLIVLLLALLAATGWAQSPTAPQAPAAPGGPADGGPVAEAPADPVPQEADAAVKAWLAREPVSLMSLSQLDAADLCRQLPDLIANPAPLPGTEVRLEDRIEQPSDDPDVRRFTYAAVRPGNQLDVVEVVMQRADGAWKAASVGFLNQNQPVGARAWLQTPAAAWVFAAFSLLVLLALTRKGSLLRRWLAAGLTVIREHRRLVAITLISLYALFGLGAFVGTTLPVECEQAVLDVVNAAIGTVGASQAYGSGNVLRAAATTYFQNFVVVTTSVTFPLAALFGVPAYVFAAASFFTQGIPFGLLASGGPIYILLLLVLLALELTSYFLVVAGGGMLLATLVRPGPPGRFARGFRKLLLMLPIAGVILLVGAWYEALIIILGLA